MQFASSIVRRQLPTKKPSLADPLILAIAASGVVALVGITGSIVAAGLTTLALGVLGIVFGRRSSSAGLADVFLVLACISILSWAPPLASEALGLAPLIAHSPLEVGFAIANGLKLIAIAPLVLVLIVRKWSLSSLMLGIGCPAAKPPIIPISWGILGPVAAGAVLVAFLTAPEVLSARHDWSESTAILFAALPMLLVGPLVNALCEELLYRHALVNSLSSITRSGAAALLSSAVFGAAHMAGNPGGASGVIAAAIFGLVCCAAMLNTRGFIWSLTIHLAADVGIICGLVLANA